MDTSTGLTILGTAIGSAKIVEKLLGPTADYLGTGLKQWTEKSFENMGRIFKSAQRRLGDKINQPGAIPPRVLKGILQEGPFCDDPLSADYFGGVLASSRSSVSRDDRGSRFVSILSNLSSYQVRSHYIFYSLFRKLYGDSGLQLTTQPDRHKLQMFVPCDAFNSAMDFGQGEDFSVLLSHSLVGLIGEDLLGERYAYGPTDILKKHGFQNPEDEEEGILVEPSILGIELFLWAHGLGNEIPGLFLDGSLVIESNIDYEISPGVRCSAKDGPRL
jgi:hypothetical protein